jgi:amino acid transporter
MGASEGRRSIGPGVTAAQAAAVLLVIGTIALFVALFLPWWSLREVVFQSTRTVVSTGFHGWGWLSIAATLVTFVAVVNLLLIAPVTNGTPGRWRDNRSVARVIVMAGTAELVGNVLFIVAAPKTEISSQVLARLPASASA